MFPRYGSYPGFNPIVELSMTFHTQVVGANGQRQAMFIERMPGLAEVILSNFTFGPHDVMIVFSASGLTAVPVEMARGRAPARHAGHRGHLGRPVAVGSSPIRAVGSRLIDEADLVIDLCTPHADALCPRSTASTPPSGPAPRSPPSPSSTAIKVRTAQLLVERGAMPPVITRASVVGAERSRILFDAAYREHARRVAGALGRRALTSPRSRAGGETDRIRPASPQIRGRSGPRRDARVATSSYRRRTNDTRDPSGRELLVGLGAVAIVAAACSSSGASTAPSAGASAGAGNVIIGISNPGAVGNGWREAMICSAKAQAVKSGNVSSVHVIHRDTDAAGQLADIRDLIAEGRQRHRSSTRPSPDALNPAIAEAIAAGIAVVAVDAPVTAPGAYNLSNDQDQYAYLGAKWLFEQMGGKGNVVYMRGIAGHRPTPTATPGFKRALAEYPDIKVAKETVTEWDQATAVTQINDILTSGLKFDGIWTSGIDNVIVDALKTAKHPLVPIVGADNAGFVKQLLNEAGPHGRGRDQPGGRRWRRRRARPADPQRRRLPPI